MPKLWFDVRMPGNLVVTVCFPGSMDDDRPEILSKLAELIRGNERPVRILAEEFPQDAEIIFALDNLLVQYKVVCASGISWNCKDGNFINIVISPKR